MASCFRTAMYVRFGGVSWATWYVAIGHLPDDLFELANGYMAERISILAGRQPRAEGKHPMPRLSKRSLAVSQGRTVPEREGVNHVTTDAKKARMRARELEKQVHEINTAWQKGYSWTTGETWNQLWQERQAPTANLLRVDSVVLVAGVLPDCYVIGECWSFQRLPANTATGSNHLADGRRRPAGMGGGVVN
jgi:hypothetical protein